MKPLVFLLVSIAALFAVPTIAAAGGCPACDTSADCMALTPDQPSFCVMHVATVGCGDQLRTCCPGQGCDTFSGRPSCEGETCTVVDGAAPPADGGVADGGPPADSGVVGVDGGGTDGGAGTDSGMGGVDGGVTVGTGRDDRSGCSATEGATGIAGALAFLALALVRPFRRRS